MPNKNEIDSTLLRANAREAALLTVMAKYRITLPRNAADWRVPTEHVTGVITGVTSGNVRLLCTDGVVGWFAYYNDRLLFGHLQHFVADNPKTFRRAVDREPKTALTEDEKKAKQVAKLRAKLAALLAN